MTNCLGVDIGGVIIDRVKGDKSDTSMFSSRYLETPEVLNAIESIAALSEGPFKGRVVVVSKAGDSMRRKSIEWLKKRDFFRRVGIPEDNLKFTYSRFEKAAICSSLAVTHFVDDKCEVLHHMALYVKDLFLFVGKDTDEHEYPAVWKRLHRVYSWKEILAHFGL